MSVSIMRLYALLTLALSLPSLAGEIFHYPPLDATVKNTNKAHLFILSGQSNMSFFNPDTSFVPAMTHAYGHNNIIVVKDAKGAQAMHMWYKDWKSPDGVSKKKQGTLYDRLMGNVQKAITNREIETITFVWMQGEQDVAFNNVEVYEQSLDGLIAQLEKDLGRTDINLIIGRLSDCNVDNPERPQWNMMRDLQQRYA